MLRVLDRVDKYRRNKLSASSYHHHKSGESGLEENDDHQAAAYLNESLTSSMSSMMSSTHSCKSFASDSIDTGSFHCSFGSCDTFLDASAADHTGKDSETSPIKSLLPSMKNSDSSSPSSSKTGLLNYDGNTDLSAEDGVRNQKDPKTAHGQQRPPRGEPCVKVGRSSGRTRVHRSIDGNQEEAAPPVDSSGSHGKATKRDRSLRAARPRPRNRSNHSGSGRTDKEDRRRRKDQYHARVTKCSLDLADGLGRLYGNCNSNHDVKKTESCGYLPQSLMEDKSTKNGWAYYNAALNPCDKISVTYGSQNSSIPRHDPYHELQIYRNKVIGIQVVNPLRQPVTPKAA